MRAGPITDRDRAELRRAREALRFHPGSRSREPAGPANGAGVRPCSAARYEGRRAVVCILPHGHAGPHEGFDRRRQAGPVERLRWTPFGRLQPCGGG